MSEVIAFSKKKRERTYEEDVSRILKTLSTVNVDYSYQLFYRLGTMDDANTALELSNFTIAFNKMIDDILVSTKPMSAKERMPIINVVEALENTDLGQCASIAVICNISKHVINTYSFEAFKVAPGVIAIRDLVRNYTRVIVRG